MFEPAVLWEWAMIAVRWTHVITAIAWIGSSFYFIALDLGLRRAGPLPPGVDGEEWQVHGGGFYHVSKYLVAPERLPAHLTWFKWEAYSTWLSGFALLVLLYYLGAELFLIDPTVMDLRPGQAVAFSVGSLAFGWLVYDALCRSRLGQSGWGLMLALFGLIVVMAWTYAQVFSGRAALLHLGAFTATIMSGNVFLCIMPNQRIVVDDLRAGRRPDPRLGAAARVRSTHNNYLTLPVLFLMLSNHYPLLFATRWNWLIASLVFLMGMTIRHWFNSRHARRGNPWWTLVATVAIFLGIAWLSARPAAAPVEAATLPAGAARFAAAPGFAEVTGIVAGRCSMCHADEPAWAGLALPPRGVRLETPAQVAHEARRIYLQAGLTHAMPPGNASFMEPAERAAIVRWFRAAHRGWLH